MKNKLLSGLFTAAAFGISIVFANAPASAFTIKGRDEAPDEFKSIIQDFRAFVGEERRLLSPETIKAKQVDLSKLTLKYDRDVKVFFIGETAGGYRNRLDYKATYGLQETTGKIFGDTSCNPGDKNFTNFSKFCPNSNKPLADKQAPDLPLNVGDWVNLGSFKAGTKLDFLLYANDINGGISNNNVKGVWSLNQALNPDGLQHTMAYYYKDFLVFGFEDLWGGGDKDYNDTVFAIDIGKQNSQAVSTIPEPSTTLAIIGIGALGFLKTRRRRSNRNI